MSAFSEETFFEIKLQSIPQMNLFPLFVLKSFIFIACICVNSPDVLV